eukprot:3936644-Rhodomonas_salina.2
MSGMSTHALLRAYIPAYATSGTAIQHVLLSAYAAPGTDPLCSYALATRCPVLRSRMFLPLSQAGVWVSCNEVPGAR